MSQPRRLILYMVGLAFFGLTTTAKSSSTTCAIEGSSFTGPDGAVAVFRYIGRHNGWKSDLALGVRAGRRNPFHWFLFDRGSARYINLISTTDVGRPGWSPPSPDGGPRPLGEMHFVAATSTLAVTSALPTSGASAPHYLLLPDLPEVLAHRANPPENVPLYFLKLARCGKRNR